jgi:hypothetical protein
MTARVLSQARVIRRACGGVAAAAVLVVAAACGGSTPHSSATAGAVPAVPTPSTLVVMGDAATAPVTQSIPVDASWPQRFFRKAMSRNTVLVNVAAQLAPAHLALRTELPIVTQLHPAVVAMMIGFVDVAEQQPTDAFSASLDGLITGARAAGARTVLVATLPEQTRGVAPYNRVIRDVVQRDGAVLVDLSPLDISFVDDQSEPTEVPDRASQLLIGNAFTAAYLSATSSSR